MRVFIFTTIISALQCVCTPEVVAQPCLTDWLYRVPITVDNTSSSSALTDFQVVATLNTSNLLLNGKIRSDGGDIRVVMNNGTAIPFWIESGTFNTTNTRLWMRVPDLPANGSTTLYLFYGNPTAASASNGNTVFELFDDFNSGTLDLSKWISCGAGTITVSGGKISMTGDAFITSLNSVSHPVTLNALVTDYTLTEGTSFVGLINDGGPPPDGHIGGIKRFEGTRIIQQRIETGVSCYTSVDESYGDPVIPTGRWEFSWPMDGHQITRIGDEILNGTDNTVSPASDQKVVFGNDATDGTLMLDFLFARQYAAIEPIATIGTELTINIPALTATNTGRTCQGQVVELSVTEVPGADYSWVDAASQVVATTRTHILSDVTPAEGGVYTVTVTIPDGCSSRDAQTTVEVDANTAGGIAGSDDVVCYGINNGSISLTDYTGDIVRWESSQTGADPWAAINNTTSALSYTNLIASVYYRAVVKNGVCDEEASNAVSITVNPATVAGELTGTSEVCDVDNFASLRLTGKTGDILRWESSENGGATWIAVPHTSQQLQLNDLTITTQYRTVVKSGVCAEKTSEPFAVTVNPLPQPSFTTTAVCEGQIMSFSNTSTITSGSIIAYLWEFGDGSSAASPNPKHVYVNSGSQDVVLSATSSAGCTNAVTSQVTVYPKPSINFSAPQTCDGFPTAFQNESVIAEGSINTYNWDFGDGTGSTDTNPKKQFFNAGTYVVTLSGVSDQGCRDERSHNVTIDQLPVANFTADEVCLGEPTVFKNASSYNAGQMTFEWDFGDGETSVALSPSHQYDAEKIYQAKLIVTTDKGCQDSVTRSVSVRTLINASAGPDVSVSKGLGVQLSASGGASYLWAPAETLNSPVIQTPVATPSETTTYVVTITDQLGCQMTDDVVVTVIDDFAVQAMNVLTPNGDGINDFWIIDNIDNYGDATVSVYDKTGRKVFEASPYRNDWGGTSGTDLLPNGTYYYVVQFADKSVAYTGSLTLLRND